jgi:hypothetical protein
MVAILDTGRRSQKVPKFELYKHNDELFNIYYGIFYELWTFTDFDRLWNLKKGEMKLKKNRGHLGYRTALTDTILKGDHLRIISAKFCWDWLSSFRGEDNFFKYYGIFYELWTFTDFDRLWNLKKGEMKLKKNLLLWN